jgi:hypothetical protein
MKGRSKAIYNGLNGSDGSERMSFLLFISFLFRLLENVLPSETTSSSP